MLFDFLNCQPLFQVLVEHPHEEILELVGQFAGAIGIPESSGIAVEGPVVDIVRFGGFEGQEARRHDEEHHPRREDVSVLPIKPLPRLNLRTHIPFSPHLPIDVSRIRTAKSEVRNFQRVTLIQQQILSFDVEVSHPTVMDVLDGINELVEVGSSHNLTESLTLFDQLIDLLVGGVLHNHHLAVGLAAGGGVFGEGPVVLVADDVGVVQHAGVVVLTFCEFRRFRLEQLNGEFLALVFRQVHVSTVPRSDPPQDLEFVDGLLCYAHFQELQIITFWNCAELIHIYGHLIHIGNIISVAALSDCLKFSIHYNLMFVLRHRAIFGGYPRRNFWKKKPAIPLMENSDFQREFGLDKKMEDLSKQVAREEILSEWKYGLPIAIFAGISLFFLISADQNDSNNMKLWLKLHHRKLLYAIVPTSSKQLFDCYYEYSTKGTGTNVLLLDIVTYLDRNELTEDMLPKLDQIVLRIFQLIRVKPTRYTMGLVQRLLEKSFEREGRLMGLQYNRKMAELCCNFGNLEQQYLGLLINPNQHIDETVINKLNSNLETYEKMLDIDLQSIHFKNNLYRKQILFIMSKILNQNPELLQKLKILKRCRAKLLNENS